MITAQTTATTDSAAAAILWAYWFSPDGAAEPLAGDEIQAALAKDLGWVWIHAGLADGRCRIWLERQAPVSANARDILLGADEHLRLDIVADEIIGVIPDLERELSAPSENFGRLRFAMTDRLLITARRHPLHSIELTHRAVEAGARFPAPILLLDGIIDHFADAIGRLCEHLGRELDVVEERVLRDDLGDERRRIGRSRLQVVRVRRELSQMKALFHRLEQQMRPATTLVGTALRGLAQKLDALDHDVAAIQERARLLQDEVAAKMTAVTNRRLFTLSMLTACLLPPTLVTGIFGMNTRDLPFQETNGGTFFALGLAAAAGALAYWTLQRFRAL